MSVFPRVDLGDVDLRAPARTVREIGDRAGDLARDVTYTAVGLSILAVQRAQVRRREIERALRR